MTFEKPLTRATLVRRYKRFLADVTLESGEMVVAHCANSGSMMGLCDPGATVWLSPNQNPKAKLDWRWELVEVNNTLVGINTARPNRIVEAAIEAHEIPELTGYETLRREVKYGENSRIDLLLEEPLAADAPGLCYVEVKNVTLRRGKEAEFPDAVTARGTKHLRELANMVREGHRAVMFYLVQRGDCQVFTIAGDIDPAYAEALNEAIEAGVEALCYACAVTTRDIRIARPLPLVI
ncbi:MAG: DNA/RNA nuclease SfsA [Proteobacteria bacterium]|nr:DNA/RNA nuclease SfsA [Pseudomonadota bacterium]